MSKKGSSSFNPWPVSIIAFFAVAICGLTAFIIFCTRHPVDLVSADYYEEEIRHQQRMESTERVAALASPARIAYDESARRITITLPADHAGAELDGAIHLYRPSAANQDRTVPLKPNAAGAQSIDATGLSDGLWRIRVSWTFQGAEYYCDEKLVLGQKAS